MVKPVYPPYNLVVGGIKNCLFPAPDRPLENIATQNIFLRVWLPEIVTGSSDIVPEFTFGTGLHI